MVGHAQEAKDYRLFVGVDLLVPQEGAPLPVESLKRRQAIVIRDNHLDQVPLTEIGAFSWAHSTKVSRAPVTIDGLQSERAFTLKNDAAMKWMNAQNNITAYQQERAAYTQMEAAMADRLSAAPARANQIFAANERAAGRQLIGNASGPQGDGQAGITSLATTDWATEAQEAFELNLDQLDAASDTTVFADKTLGAMTDARYDVMELKFAISSREPIADAYVVIMGSIKLPDEETDGVVTFHHNVGRVGPEPRKITVRKTGFPPGFDINEVKLHVYAHGKELGTNLSEKNIAMTRQQAREFLLLSHLSEHALETVAPEPVWELMPSALLAAEDREAFNYSVVVNIDADGSVISIHQNENDARAFLDAVVDESKLRTRSTAPSSFDGMVDSVRIADRTDINLDQTGRLPADVSAAIADMVFLPALDIGAPVAGMTSVNLADFFR